MTEFIAKFRIYYEDTDAGGIVYHANYLKYAERARTDMLRHHNINLSDLEEKEGILVVLRSAKMELLKSAKLDDIVEVRSKITKITAVKIYFNQPIYINNILCADIETMVVFINKKSKPTRIPKYIKELF